MANVLDTSYKLQRTIFKKKKNIKAKRKKAKQVQWRKFFNVLIYADDEMMENRNKKFVFFQIVVGVLK